MNKTNTLNIVEKPLQALLVGVNSGNDTLFYYQMEELKNLCFARGIAIKDTINQNLPKINPVTYVGSGKIEEINQLASALEVDYIIFNDELSPIQLKNIELVIDDEIEIIDRTMLILDIFESLAKTKEASLQVEVARLKYSLPRLIGKRRYLSRTAGGGAGGGGARRGLGETKLELDRRQIVNQIERAKTELIAITKARSTSRKRRSSSNTPVVAFVGYTNSGKSSTINTLLSLYSEFDKNLFVKDMLFATLDTATRSIKLPNNHEFLITDTVGFVSKLPHHLIDSFKSTLEEITEASLIVHIIDASSPFMDLQIDTTNQVLKELGAEAIPTIYAFNKMDLVKEPRFITSRYDNPLLISSYTKEGYEKLVNAMEDLLFPKEFLLQLLIPYSNGEIYSVLKEKTEVLTTEYTDNGIKVLAKMSEHLSNLYQEFIIKSNE